MNTILSFIIMAASGVFLHIGELAAVPGPPAAPQPYRGTEALQLCVALLTHELWVILFLDM